MSASIIQFKAGSTNSASPFSLTFDSSPTQGNVICVIVNSDATVTGPSGYTNRGTNVGGQGAYIWDKVAGVSESATITVTPSVADSVAMVIVEIGGTSGFDAISSVASTQGGGAKTSRTINSLTTAAGNGDLVIAAALPHSFITGTITPSWDNGFAALATAGPTTSGSSGLNCIGFVASATVAASTAVGVTTCSWTGSSAGDTTGWHIAYTSSASPASLTPIPWLRF